MELMVANGIFLGLVPVSLVCMKVDGPAVVRHLLFLLDAASPCCCVAGPLPAQLGVRGADGADLLTLADTALAGVSGVRSRACRASQ
jgi:hypothetical protein